ncbi:MAG TPA: hypothetical protein VJN21_12805 [Candidatus Acidoferrales bacterium]|nr:hypothetical protein [Candidatus Acidoferrales bacterium]
MNEKPGNSKEGRGVSRREFGRNAAIALAGGAVAASAKPASGLTLDSLADAARMAQEQAESGLSAAAQAEVEAKMQHIVAAFGSRLSEDQKKRLRGTVTYHVRMLEAIRPMAVANGDAPATVLELITDANGASLRKES